MVKALRKHRLTLIEVLIAFALIMMCALPLIYPHVFMIQKQREFIRKIELDNAVNILYGEMIASLQMNRIPLSDIIDSRIVPITEKQLRASGYESPLNYTGSYQFTLNKKKSNKEGTEIAYLLNLTYTFIPKFTTDSELKKKQTLTYNYQVFMVQGQEMTEEQNEDEQHPDDEHEAK